MSVACCRVPNFLLGMTYRHHPEWMERPLALLGTDEQVWAASPEARVSGVQVQMSAQHARMRCPNVWLRPLDVQACENEHSTLLGTLARSGLPIESPTWGMAYVDMRAVARTALAVRPFCIELGQQVGHALQEPLNVSLGWDTGKFTAHAAAHHARPKHARLVNPDDELKFLNPQPITLLPLPSLTLQQLDWLGIRTLGQFAQLPTNEVVRRFGPAGKYAQQWARGHDTRPVCATERSTPEPIEVEFDPPTALHTAVLEQTWSALQQPLTELAQQLEGCRRLRLDVYFANHETRDIHLAFIEPLGAGAQLRAQLAHQLQILNWPDEVERVHVQVLATGELLAQQLSLFPLDDGQSEMDEMIRALCGRHGAVLLQAHVRDNMHPIAERRFVFDTLARAVA